MALHFYDCGANRAFTAQAFQQSSPAMRTQVDYAACFKTNDYRSLKGLHDIMRGVVPKLNDFVGAKNAATAEKHACLWFDSRKSTLSSFKAAVPFGGKDFRFEFKDIGL